MGHNPGNPASLLGRAIGNPFGTPTHPRPSYVAVLLTWNLFLPCMRGRGMAHFLAQEPIFCPVRGRDMAHFVWPRATRNQFSHPVRGREMAHFFLFFFDPGQGGSGPTRGWETPHYCLKYSTRGVNESISTPHPKIHISNVSPADILCFAAGANRRAVGATLFAAGGTFKLLTGAQLTHMI